MALIGGGAVILALTVDTLLGVLRRSSPVARAPA
jgi:hypothetical protein